jgi:hypothetical protein
MTVRVYYSTDASAPALTGVAGSFIAVLDACLVNGYGAKAAAGWTKPFSGTNLAVYRGSTGNRFFFRVDDTAGQTIRHRGYETMSDVNTGTGLFPTEAQFTGGLWLYKSVAANSTARPWIMVATEQNFYFFADPGSTAQFISNYTSMFFGNIVSYKSGDAYNTLICGPVATSIINSHLITLVNTLQTTCPGHYITRNYAQIGGSVTANKYQGDAPRAGSSIVIGSPSSNLQFPNPITGTLDISPIFVAENNLVVVRGLLPGMWAPLHNYLVLNNGETFTGTGEMAGKTFLLINVMQGDGQQGRVAMEISDTW